MASAPFLASILMLVALEKNNTSTTPKPSPRPTKSRVQATTTDWLPKILEKLANVPSATARVKMYCRSGFYLVVLPNGHVRGTRNETESDLYGKFELQTYALKTIRMKNLATNRYIGINSKGRVFSTTKPTNETLLVEKYHENHFNSYRSSIYKSTSHGYNRYWYLAIKHNGKMKNAQKVNPQRYKTFHFLALKKKAPENKELIKILKILGIKILRVAD